MKCYDFRTEGGTFNGIKVERLSYIEVGAHRFPIPRSLLDHPRSIRDEYLLEADLMQHTDQSSGQTSYVITAPADEPRGTMTEDRALVRACMDVYGFAKCEVHVEGEGKSIILTQSERPQIYHPRPRRKEHAALLVLQKNSPVRLVQSFTPEHKCDFFCRIFGCKKPGGSWRISTLIEFDGQVINTQYFHE